VSKCDVWPCGCSLVSCSSRSCCTAACPSAFCMRAFASSNLCLKRRSRCAHSSLPSTLCAAIQQHRPFESTATSPPPLHHSRAPAALRNVQRPLHRLHTSVAAAAAANTANTAASTAAAHRTRCNLGQTSSITATHTHPLPPPPLLLPPVQPLLRLRHPHLHRRVRGRRTRRASHAAALRQQRAYGGNAAARAAPRGAA